MDGKIVAEDVKKDVRRKVAMLKERGVAPHLAGVQVGEEQSSKKYLEYKQRDCMEVGIDSTKLELPANVSEEELSAKLKELSDNAQVHGILLQLPVPDHISRFRVLGAIKPEKDVDGLHPTNVGELMLGNYSYESSLLPCTPKGIMRLLDYYGVEVEGRFAVIINRSDLVGKPLFKMLLDRNATVVVCHSKTRDVEKYCRQADILVSAVGRRPSFLVTSKLVKEGAVVVDVGISYIGGKLYGDVNFDDVVGKASYVTPMPGGVGPMTRAMLLENTVIAAGKQTK